MTILTSLERLGSRSNFLEIRYIAMATMKNEKLTPLQLAVSFGPRTTDGVLVAYR